MKNEKLEIIESNEFQNLFDKSKKLIDSARSNMGQMANAITVLTSFLLGRYIIEQEQQGSERAKYGAKVLDSLSSYLTEEYGRGFSRSNVAGMRQFYMAYKDREDEIIQSGIGQFEQAFGIVQSGIGQLETAYKKIPFKLSWTHYQILMRMQMYVNYYDRYEKIEGENPTIGILLCKQSDEALVDLTLPENANIYAKEYKLYLPDKKLLQKKLKEWLDEEQN